MGKSCCLNNILDSNTFDRWCKKLWHCGLSFPINCIIPLSLPVQVRTYVVGWGSDNISDENAVTSMRLCRMWCSCELLWPQTEVCGRLAECRGHGVAPLPAFCWGFQSESKLASPANEYFFQIRQYTFSGFWMKRKLSFVGKEDF